MGKGKLRQLDLCSGVGVGFPLSGIITGKVQLCGLCEIDSFCKEILQKRFPGVPIYNSVRDLGIQKGEIDTITASPPCQPFSLEGKRLGKADERDCIPAVLRLVARIQPKFFCLENVPGLLSAPQYPGEKPGTYFQQMLQQLYECGLIVPIVSGITDSLTRLLAINESLLLIVSLVAGLCLKFSNNFFLHLKMVLHSVTVMTIDQR